MAATGTRLVDPEITDRVRAWPRRRPLVATAAALLAVAALVWIVYGTGYVDYDLLYGLLWGHQLGHGITPNFNYVHAPTPHPLVNAISLVVAPLGGGALTFWHIVGVLALAFLAWAAYRLGRELVSWPVGVVFAAILLTRQLLLDRAFVDSIDIPFLALVLLAASLEVERPRRGPAVLAVLAVAGLLRPEAWLLAAAYAVYATWGLPVRERLPLFALALAGPVVWLGFDLIVSGDPLLSLHHTSSAAQRIGRPRGLRTAITHAPTYLKGDLHVAALAGGLLGAVAATMVLKRRAIIPWALIVLGGLAFLAFGVSGQPLLPRYLFMPASMLALFCAVLLVGWRDLAIPRQLRPWWLAAAALVLAGLLVTAPSERTKLTSLAATAHRTARADSDLHTLSRAPAARAWFACRPLQVADFRGAPLLAFYLGRDPSAVTVQRTVTVKNGVLIAPPPRGGRNPAPSGFKPVYRNRSWILYERCPAGGRVTNG